MQTFLPYPDFMLSAQCLDWRRLGKQRVEALQILNCLNPESTRRGWQNHPAVKMWRGYEEALKIYANTMIAEWVLRGYNNTMSYYPVNSFRFITLPHWLGDQAFHASHRSNLLRKDPKHYGRFDWTEGPDIKYVWPVK